MTSSGMHPQSSQRPARAFIAAAVAELRRGATPIRSSTLVEGLMFSADGLRRSAVYSHGGRRRSDERLARRAEFLARGYASRMTRKEKSDRVIDLGL